MELDDGTRYVSQGKDAKDLSEWGYRWGTLEDVAALKFEKEVGGVAAAKMNPEDQRAFPQLVDAQDVYDPSVPVQLKVTNERFVGRARNHPGDAMVIARCLHECGSNWWYGEEPLDR